MTFDLVSARRWFFLGSGIVIAISLVMLAIPPTLRPGIEFTSGTTTLLRFEQDVSHEDLRAAYADLGHEEARIQSSGEREFLIRTRRLDVPEGSFSEVSPEPSFSPVGPTPVATLGIALLGAEDAGGTVLLFTAVIDGDSCALGDTEIATLAADAEAIVLERNEGCGDAGTVLRVLVGSQTGYLAETDTHDFVASGEAAADDPAAGAGERAIIEEELRARFGAFHVLEFASVSPVVSRVAVRNAAVAVVVASLFIMGYVAFAFWGVPRPFVYAACAILALLHDVVIVLGAFSFLGKAFGAEINLMFVTGLLTVIGFSVHDSIVVFDRIRENVTLQPQRRLAVNVNAALTETLSRSFNTSVTLLLTVLSLLLLGGATVQGFLLVILVGVIAGTYSSIGVAAQLLVAFEERDLPRLWAWLRGRGSEQAAA